MSHETAIVTPATPDMSTTLNDRPVSSSGSVPGLEKDVKKSRLSLRRTPDVIQAAPILTPEDRKNRSKSKTLLPDNEQTLLKVELLPNSIGTGASVEVTGYGTAPRVVEVFPSEDLDDVFEAEDLEQIELNIQTQTQQQVLNLDLSSEYQRPRLDRALAYRKLHMPTKSDGELFPFWGTKTGRFLYKRCARIDCFREGRKSEFISFGPGVSGYFKFLKSMTWLFFFLTLFSLPFLIINTNAGTNFSYEAFPFAQTTLGNLYVNINSSSILLSNLTAVEAVNKSVTASEFDTYVLILPGACPAPEGCIISQGKLLIGYAIWDVAICFILVLAVNILLSLTRHENKIYKNKIPKIEDYSIETTVPLDADAKGLQAHFESLLAHISSKAKEVEMAPVHSEFHNVYDVQIVESTGNAISLCIQRGILLKRLARLDAQIKSLKQRGVNESRIAPFQKKYEKTRDKIQKLDEKALSRAEKGKALMAFVTFQTQEAKLRILDEYDIFWFCGKEPEKLKYNGKFVMQVKEAPPPSTLLWENQELPFFYRTSRLIISFFLLGAILGITCGLSFVTDANRAFGEIVDAASGTDFVLCNGKYKNVTSILEQSILAQENGDQQCFCDYELIAPAVPGQSTGFLFSAGGFCENFELSRIEYIGEEIGLSFVVFIINMIIFKIVLVTADFMKFRNVVAREFAVLRTIFVMTYINSAIICVLVNADWSTLTGHYVPDVTFGGGTTIIKIGQFVDFEPNWYPKVGVELYLIALLNIFAPHTIPLFRYFYHLVERRYLAPYAVSQQVLNEMYIGEDFLLSARLAQNLGIFFFTMTFSSGIPLLYPIACVSFFVAYWFDKLFFIRLVRTPPQFDATMQVWFVKAMEWAIILHCLIGFWMYSSPRVFPLTDAEAQQSVLTNLQQTFQINPSSNSTLSSFDFPAEFIERFSRTQSLIMLGGALIVAALKALRRFGRAASQFRNPAHVCMNAIRAMIGRKHRMRHIDPDILAADSFEGAMLSSRIAGIRSYNILANPVYQRVFQLQGGIGEENHREKTSGSESSPAAAPSSHDLAQAGSYKGFQSLQDALNIRKGTAVSSIEGRSMWRDDKSSVNSGTSKVTTALYTPKTPTTNIKTNSATTLLKSNSSGGDNDDDDKNSVKSKKSTKSSKLIEQKTPEDV